MEENTNFSEVFEKAGIRVYIGIVHDIGASDIGLKDVNDFIEYCTLNGIKTVFLNYEYQDEEALDYEQIKTRLTFYYNHQLKKYPYAEEFLPKHITQDFFMPALTETIEELEQDSARYSETIEEETEEDGLISVIAWAIHSGFRIYAPVYEKEESELEREESISEGIYLDKYAKKMISRLEKLYKDAQTESVRIQKEIEKEILEEIWRTVCNNKELIKMNTQKARYEFADRIQIRYQEERGCDWLTKKQVRSMVEYRYVKLTE